MWKPRKCAAYLVISKNLLHVYSSAVVWGSNSFSPVKIYRNLQGQTSTVRLIKTSIKGHRTSLVCRVSFHQNNIVKIFPQPPCWIRSAECKQRSRRKFSCNFAFRKKGKKAKQNADLIRVVYLFRSKRVFAFVAFIPILPARGALEDELPRNTKF